MASRQLNLFVDVDQGRLVSSFLSTIQTPSPRFIFGDSVPVVVRALTSNASTSQPWKEIDLTGQTMRVAIGSPAGSPTAGTFTITYGANTTTALAFDASAATISAAVNLLADIITDGGVTVTKTSSGIIRITFVTVGAKSDFTVDATSITPSSGADVAIAVAGGSSSQEVAVIRIETSPAAYAELADELPVSALTATVIRNGSSTRGTIQTLEFPVIPYAGFYTLSILNVQTSDIAWNASAATIQAAIEAVSTVGAGKVTVTGSMPLFTVSFNKTVGTVGVVSAMLTDVTGLISPTGRSGTIDTNTAGMIELLNGSSQASAKIEIELYTVADSTTWTILQTDCVCIDDVISNSPISIAGGPAYVTTDTLDVLRPPPIIMATPPVNTSTTATVLGQLVIVEATDGAAPAGTTHDVWICVQVSPSIWQPPGDIMRDRTTNVLWRNSLNNGVPSLNLAYA